MPDQLNQVQQSPLRQAPVTLLAIGLTSGLLSGLFGVGGGVLIVPALVLLAGFGQKLAHGTSLAAVVPISVTGALGYAMEGSVNWVVAALLAAGSMAGALIGTWLLHVLPVRWLRYGFAALLLLTAVRLGLETPHRLAEAELDVGGAVLMLALGLLVGTLSGLFGVGGGIIMVPAMILLFGISDVVAKGTSLLVVIPTGIIATVQNLKRGNADLRSAALLGLAGVVSAYGGVRLALLLPPRVSVLLFAALLAFTAYRMVRTKD
ncbi:sulfite exporter TauE/SafE family protein [Crossiella sp. SN42]|uniref:sulfite exporter TauE/SafE family protein n=1 Tax=Crossiella sp. SN42 TaxID=2944808 RepID=UPI00207C347E|nr:sulfite exporter TauE/SafE family protein [Crossiella sp. SN42]MCO1577460.1 sulfite exporter TauE/SafE family protein [Crossiella sp. SN42]